MKLWHRHGRPEAAEDYPSTIPGRLILRTGDQIELVATLTGEIDDRGIRTCQLRPAAGGISIDIDVVPGRSSMRWGFLPEPPDSPWA